MKKLSLILILSLIHILYDGYFGSNHFLPIFFVTVACGIVSGFHATQATLVSRTIQHERQGRTVFYLSLIHIWKDFWSR